jgi:hypothetical protein
MTNEVKEKLCTDADATLTNINCPPLESKMDGITRSILISLLFSTGNMAEIDWLVLVPVTMYLNTKCKEESPRGTCKENKNKHDGAHRVVLLSRVMGRRCWFAVVIIS